MIVVDASVAAKWFIEEPDTRVAMELLIGEADISAPDLIVPEVLNAFWKHVRRGLIEAAQLSRVGSVLPSYFSDLVTSSLLAPRAIEIALELDHPVYDALYVSLAERMRTLLVTADEALVRKTRDTPFAGVVKRLSS